MNIQQPIGGAGERHSTTAVNPSEAVEEKVSFSDRFGLWIGSTIVARMPTLTWCAVMSSIMACASLMRVCAARRSPGRWHAAGAQGRVAFQYIQDLAGPLGVRLDGSDER